MKNQTITISCESAGVVCFVLSFALALCEEGRIGICSEAKKDIQVVLDGLEEQGIEGEIYFM